MSAPMNTLRRESSSFLRFCVVGAFGLVVDASALLALVKHAGTDPFSVRLLSIAFAV